MNNKVLVIVCDHYLPGYKAGGPIVSISYLVQTLKEKYRIVVVTRDRDIGDKQPYEKIIINRATDLDDYHVLYVDSKWQLIKAIFKSKPNIIYFNSLFSRFSFVALIASFFLRHSPMRVMAPRGELGKGALKIKPTRKRMFISVFRYSGFSKKMKFHATSLNEAEDIRKELHASAEVVANIPSPPYVNLTKKTKRPSEVKFVYLSRITKKKNLAFALQAIKSATRGNILFDIFGPQEDKKYWKECLNLIQELPGNIQVNYRGAVPQAMVRDILSEYHALLLPTANENFGHVIAESLQSGTLPIISDQTPWRGLELEGVGWDVSLNNLSEFTRAINKVILLDQEGFDLMSRRAMNYVQKAYNVGNLTQAYLSLFEID